MKKTYLNTLTPEEIIKRLKNGEIVKRKTVHDNEIIYKMIDGIIVREDEGCTTLNSFIAIDDQYFEEKRPFMITKTGVYKTRDGRKAYVCNIDDNGDCTFVIEGESRLYYSTKQGSTSDQETEMDIVSEWED